MQPLDLWTRSFPGVQRVDSIENIVGQLGQGATASASSMQKGL